MGGAMLKRQSEEEREAKRPDKQERQSAEAQAKAERLELEQVERERQAFLASPAGQARTAFERGDQLFQFEIDVKNTQAVVCSPSSCWPKRWRRSFLAAWSRGPLARSVRTLRHFPLGGGMGEAPSRFPGFWRRA
jgi:hypothetical protein